MGKFIDLTGKEYGRLTVLRRAIYVTKGRTYWVCSCSCGNPKEAVVFSSNLTMGLIKSCGCLLQEYREGGTRAVVNNTRRRKMTPELAELVRSMHAEEDVTIAELARINDVSYQTIANIVHNKSWTGKRAKKRCKLGIMAGYEDLIGKVRGGI